MQLVVNPVADQSFLSNLRAPNVLIARKRRRTLLRFLSHAAGVGVVLTGAVFYLNTAAARAPRLAAATGTMNVQPVADIVASPVDGAKASRFIPL